MLTVGRFTTLILAVGFLATLEILAIKQRGGPPHLDFDLPNSEPATLYLPGNAPGNAQSLYDMISINPPPAALRPPAVVLIHGYSADRVGMGTLARRIAQNGYGVLAIDLHGHGENRNPFSQGFAERDVLYDDVKNAVDYLRASQLVDASRIVVLGHSMGAGVALDYANRDANIAGSVMVSGGWSLWGPERPRNALFIFAQYDPQFISSPSMRIAARLANVEQIELSKFYGDTVKGNAVEAVRVPHVDHVQIINSPEATKTIIQWLDAVSRFNRTGSIKLGDPRRLTSAIAFILFLILLIPMGRICASMVAAWPRREAGGGGLSGLVVLATALAAALPLIAIVPPVSFISLEGATEVVSWLAVAGLLMVFWLMVMRPDEFRQAGSGLGAAFLAASLAVALIYAMETPTSVTTHRLALTPERLVAAIISTILLAPFSFSFELLVRRGSIAKSALCGLFGRLVIVMLLAAGVWLGALPIVAGLMIGLFVIVFVAFEIFASATYSTSGNLALIALVESAWLAWTMAAFMPITISF